tara:strand:- start:133 stop:615 length:483 start_codon:yes stop_codon:yes gene_type:complete
MVNQRFPVEGRCTCGQVHYTMHRQPMFVHCCHCSWCQRETGSAFAINALIESDQLRITKGAIEQIETPSNSGSGQVVVRCPRCEVALWSHYGAAKEKVAFVRVGTLNNPNLCPPDIHIYTSTQQDWIELGDTAVKVDEFYRRSEYWPAQSLERYQLARAV